MIIYINFIINPIILLGEIPATTLQVYSRWESYFINLSNQFLSNVHWLTE